MAISLAERAEQLRVERRLLIKADADIEEGSKRLRNQQDLFFDLQAAGHDTTQAERLVLLLEQTLLQWECHRTLIEQRIAYLENELYPVPVKGK
ncbi:hypothetical protein [Bradyrhizobium sp. USDA 10063]